MDQISRLIFDVIGRDSGGSKVLNNAALSADRAHQGMSRLGSTLTGLGGPFDQVTMLAGQFGNAIEGNLAKAQKFGLGLTAAGVGLIAFASKDQQAQRQLQQTVDTTGAAYADYRSQINATITAQEHNAHTADDTQNALNTLTIANQNVTTSLKDMNFVADIAATKHESLAQAAQQLVLMESGNTRAFKSFGIVLDTTKDKSTEVDKALHTLQDRLSGQASASVDTFTGHLKADAAALQDHLAALGKYGPAVALVGAGLTVLSSALQFKAAKQLADTAATAVETQAESANAAARLRTADAATVQAAAIQRATLAQSEGAAIGGAMGAAVPGFAGVGGRFARAGGYAIGGYAAGQIVPGSAGTVASDALYGASIASVLPGVGTLAGAGGGALFGLVDSMTRQSSQSKLSGSDQALLAKFGSTRAGQVDLKGLAGGAQYLADVKGATAVTGHLADVVNHASKADDQAALSAGQYAQALLKQKDASVKAMNSLDAQIKNLETGSGAALKLSQAEDDLQQSMHNLAQSVHDGSNALHGHTAAAEANRAALRDSVSKMLGLIQAQKDAGVSGDKVRASAIAMSQALEHNAGEILGNKAAVDKFLAGLRALPPQIAAALGATEILAEQVGEQVMSFFAAGLMANASAPITAAKVGAAQAIKGLRLGDTAGGGTSQSYVPVDTKAAKSAQNYGKHLADTVVNSYAPVVASGVSAATSAAMDKAKQRLDQMRQLEKQTAQQVAQEFHGIVSQVQQGFDIANLPQRTDSFGSSFGARDPRRAARQFVHDLETWAHLLSRLRKAGLNQTMLDQFEQAGVAAIPAMREVLRGHEIKSLNRAEREITTVAGKVAGAEVSAHDNAHLARVLQLLPSRLAADLKRELRHLHIQVSVREHDRKQGKKIRQHG